MRTRQPVYSLFLTSRPDHSAAESDKGLRFPDASDAATPGNTMNDVRASDHRLVFPRQAVDAMMACKRSTRQPCALATEIERTLETMQQKLDSLKDDVQNYRLPTFDGPPPIAA